MCVGQRELAGGSWQERVTEACEGGESVQSVGGMSLFVALYNETVSCIRPHAHRTAFFSRLPASTDAPDPNALGFRARPVVATS